MWPFTGYQGVETELSYCMCTNLYRIFLGNWPEVWVKMQEILWMLDENYGLVMTFDALNKELYMLHQGYQQGVSKHGVQLPWHVWIIQNEFPGCIGDEYLEGVECDCFYIGLKEEYQVMLAHKMEDMQLATYAELLKAMRQIEK